MPCNKPEDSVLIINAYEKVYKLPDKETQKLFLDLIQRLRYRDATIEKLIAAWDKSATQLCNAVKAIDNQNK